MEESEVKVAKIDAAMGLAMTKPKHYHDKEWKNLREHAIKYLKTVFEAEENDK